MKILEVIEVTKNFGNLTVLKNVNFALEEGEIFSIIGPNGAGKTTLVNMITGIISCSAGDIRFLGKSICGYKPHQIGRLGISRTFEIVPPAIRMTAMENVMVGALFGRTRRERTAKAARTKAEETLDLLGLAKKRDVPAENLTILERKRLEIATALAMSPKLLLLDEVMAGLNPTELDEGVELIKKIRNTGLTVLVIEHVMRAIAGVSDRIIVIHNGQKVSEGIPEEVLEDSQVIAVYLGKRCREFAESEGFQSHLQFTLKKQKHW